MIQFFLYCCSYNGSQVDRKNEKTGLPNTIKDVEKVPSKKRHHIGVFSCLVCISGHRKDAEHKKTSVLVSFHVWYASVDEKCQAQKDSNAGVFSVLYCPPQDLIRSDQN